MNVLPFFIVALLPHFGTANSRDDTSTKITWRKNCNIWANNIKVIVDNFLRRNKGTETPSSIQQILTKLETNAKKLSENIMERHHTNLLKPLISHHAKKIVNFCTNMRRYDGLMTDGEHRQLFAKGMSQWVNARAVQLQLMVHTTFVDFRQVWSLIKQFEQMFNGDEQQEDYGPPILLIENIFQKVEEMHGQLLNDGQHYQTYYRDENPFIEAREQLVALLSTVKDLNNEKYVFDNIMQIVPNLWANATTNMFENVTNDLMSNHTNFYGFTILFELFQQMKLAKRIIYNGFLSESKSDSSEIELIKKTYNRLMDGIAQHYEQSKFSKIGQLEIIGLKLKKSMALLKSDPSWAGFLRSTDGEFVTIKRATLKANLLKIKILLLNAYNELDMVDLMGSCTVIQQKFVELDKLLSIAQIGSSEDELELLDEILIGLKTDELIQTIEEESVSYENL